MATILGKLNNYAADLAVEAGIQHLVTRDVNNELDKITKVIDQSVKYNPRGDSDLMIENPLGNREGDPRLVEDLTALNANVDKLAHAPSREINQVQRRISKLREKLKNPTNLSQYYLTLDLQETQARVHEQTLKRQKIETIDATIKTKLAERPDRLSSPDSGRAPIYCDSQSAADLVSGSLKFENNLKHDTIMAEIEALQAQRQKLLDQ